jgi:hypothetical protein
MFDFPALDVAIGLIFLFVLLALVCSTINEAISAIVGLRARFLQLGIMNLLSGDTWPTEAGKEWTAALYKHPLVQSLIRPGRGLDVENGPDAKNGDVKKARTGRLRRAWRWFRQPTDDPTKLVRWWQRPAPYPSYLPSRTFVAALTDIAEQAEQRLEGEDDDDALEEAKKRLKRTEDNLKKSLAAIPNAPLRDALLTIYKSAGDDVERFHHAAEQWFDDSMERVSGWYKRRVQFILLVIGTIVVLLLNADTLGTARVLWRDDAVRAAVVEQARAAAEEGDASEIDVDKEVAELDVPLGWTFSSGDAPTEFPNDVLGWLAKFVGLAITVGAVMLGAPFWFDLLSKIMRVRTSGAPPPASDATRSGEGEQRRSGSRA